jgi:hypothetical protein
VQVMPFETITDEETGAQTNTPWTTQDFLSRTNLSVSETFRRAMSPEYVYGTYDGTEQGRFLIFVVRPNFFEAAFSSTLRWETDMYSDVRTLLALPDITTNNSNEVQQSTTQQTASGFIDVVVNNTPARGIPQENGEYALLWSMPHNGVVVVAHSKDALAALQTELLARQ